VIQKEGPAERFDSGMEVLAYKELLSEMDSAIEWLKQLGISKVNRIRQYHANLALIVEADEAGSLDRLREKMGLEKLREVLWTWVDSFEFVDVFKSLKDMEPAEVLPVLTRAIGGPADAYAEMAKNSSNAPRNFMFELVLAARMARAGLKPQVQEPDVFVHMDEWRLLIQCKRPMSISGIQGNIVSAGRQLRRDLDNDRDRNLIGVVALSVSKVFNPGDKILEVPHREDLSVALSHHVETVWSENKKSFTGLSDPRIQGAMIHLVTPTALTEEKIFLAAGTTHVYSFRSTRDEQAVLKDLESLMQASALHSRREENPRNS
jgi:hypothetical protein